MAVVAVVVAAVGVPSDTVGAQSQAAGLHAQATQGWSPRGDGLSVIGQAGGRSLAGALSPDGRYLLLAVGARIWRVDLDVEPPQWIDASPVLAGDVTQISWNGTLLVAAAGAAGLVVFDMRREGAAWRDPIGSYSPPGRHAFRFTLNAAPTPGAAADVVLVDRPESMNGSAGDRAIHISLRDPAAPAGLAFVVADGLLAGALLGDVFVLTLLSRTVRFVQVSPNGATRDLPVNSEFEERSYDVHRFGSDVWLFHTHGLALLVRVDGETPGADPRIVFEENVVVSRAPAYGAMWQDVLLIADGDATIWQIDRRTPGSSAMVSELRYRSPVAAGPIVVGNDRLLVLGEHFYYDLVAETGEAVERRVLWTAGPSSAIDVAFKGACGLASNGVGGGMVSWLNLTDPEHVRFGESVRLAFARVAAAPDGFFVATNGHRGTPDLMSFRCGALAESSSLRVPEPMVDIVVVGDQALATTGYQLSHLDLTTPLEPEPIGLWPSARLAAVAQDLAYEDGTLAVLLPGSMLLAEYTPPDPPTERATVPVPAGATDIALLGGHAYIAAPGGIWTFDVRDPSAPRSLGSLDMPGTPRSLAAAPPGRLWVAVDDGGTSSSVRMLDVRPGTIPSERAWTAVPGRVASLAASGRLALVAAENAGVLVVLDPRPSTGPTVYLPALAGTLSR